MKVLEYENRFGRRGGRGLRPWLLIPKVLAVGVYFGGLSTLLSLWLVPRRDKYDVFHLLDVTRHILHIVLPALVLAILLGIALLLQHPRELLRMRWLLIKLALLAVCVPSAHLFLSSRLALVYASVMDRSGRININWGAMPQFRWGLATVVFASAVVIILGRLKPRLGQNPAKSAMVPNTNI